MNSPRPGGAPVGAQGRDQVRRQQREAIRAAFALAKLEAQAIGGAFGVSYLQDADFQHPQAGGVGGHQ